MIDVASIMNGSVKSDVPPCPPSTPEHLDNLRKPGESLAAPITLTKIAETKGGAPAPSFVVEEGTLVKGRDVDVSSPLVGTGGEVIRLEALNK